MQNLFMSVDPYIRGRMKDRESYVLPFKVGEQVVGGGLSAEAIGLRDG